MCARGRWILGCIAASACPRILRWQTRRRQHFQLLSGLLSAFRRRDLCLQHTSRNICGFPESGIGRERRNSAGGARARIRLWASATNLMWAGMSCMMPQKKSLFTGVLEPLANWILEHTKQVCMSLAGVADLQQSRQATRREEWTTCWDY